MPKGSATAPIRVVIASSPPTCRAVGSRASITFPFREAVPVNYTPLVERVQLSNDGPDGPSVRIRETQEPPDIECVRCNGFQEDIFQTIFRTLLLVCAIQTFSLRREASRPCSYFK